MEARQLTSDGAATFVPNTRYAGPNRPQAGEVRRAAVHQRDGRVLGAASGHGDRATPGGSEPADLGRLRARHRRAAGAGAEVPGLSADRVLSRTASTTSSRTSTTPRSGRSSGSCTSARPSSTSSTRPAGSTPTTTVSACPPTARCRRSRRTRTRTRRPRSTRTRSACRGQRGSCRAHGWKVVANGTTSCARPGTGRGECGAGHHGRQAAALHAHVPERHVLHRRLDGRPAVGRAAGRDPDHAQGGHHGDDRPRDRAVRAAHRRLQLAARQVRRAPGCSSPTTTRPARRSSRPARSATSATTPNPAIDRLIKATTTTSARGAQRALDAYANAVRAAAAGLLAAVARAR